MISASTVSHSNMPPLRRIARPAPAGGARCSARAPAWLAALAACWLTLGGTLALLAPAFPGRVA